jgi:putative ABC transport system ATP-binding protein
VSVPVVALESASKSYGALNVLRGADFAIAPGELVVVTGASGSGKSTLLNLLGLMDTPSAGRVLHQGRDLSAATEKQRSHERLRGVGFVFQHYYLVPTLSAARNIALPMKAAGVDAHERDERVAELLDGVGLAGREDHFPHELSGGQQQMVAVARALANKPPLILADEPTGELDEENGARVMARLRAAASGGTAVVLVTHQPATAPASARRLRLTEGRLVEERA